MIDNKPVIIFGANSIGKNALDIFNSNNQMIYCLLDDDKELHGTEIGDVSILSNCDDRGYIKFIGNKCDAFIASDDNEYRKSLIEMIVEERKVMPVNAIHNLANVSPTAQLGYGNFVGLGVVINAFAKISNHAIIQSGATIDAEVNIGDYVQIGIGSNIGAQVTLEESAFVGSGVTIVPGVKIGKNARIGAGSVVITDVKDGDTVFGNPAASVNK